MTNKPGLLPKWLFVYTTLKTIYILAAYKNCFNVFKSPDVQKSIYAYLVFLLGSIRLLASRRITMVEFYFSIATSFLMEGLFFVYGGFYGVYDLRRVLIEVFLAVFTLAWMIFLYPYYLLEEKEELKRE